VADHRWPVRPSEMEGIARNLPPAVMKDLQANRGASIVIAGDDQPPVVHALAMALNQQLGNVGSTVEITDPIEVAPVNELESLRKLVSDMNAGTVKALVMLGGNPVFNAPADFNFVQALGKVPFRAHLSRYEDETSMQSHWHIPELHDLESWSDVRAHDGTISIVQPLIAPLYNGRSPHEVAGAMVGGLDQSPYEAVRAYWFSKGANEQTWRKWLHDGLIAGSALPHVGRALQPVQTPNAQRPTAHGLEIVIKPDPTLHDGRFANHSWLQELPKPQSKICWENVALLSPKTAAELGFDERTRAALANERTTTLADVSFHGHSIRMPLWPIPGHPDNVVTVFLGYGRANSGHVGNGVGTNVYPMRFSDAMHGGAGAQVSIVRGDPYPIACTQEHQSLNPADMYGADRGIIRVGTFADFQKDPAFMQKAAEKEENTSQSMWPLYEYKSHAWAMVIDTSVCTGCNGCVIACQAENNIAVVGKDQVHREREMHWLRIDRYYRGEPSNPQVVHEPVPCMQCEQAPCEPVCPVEATSHSGDGLNDMTYNRCVGTRYCSNNCPYKVRRFNFYHYSDYDTPALKPMRNPDVTIRTRGVMEKCTYCVQRINEAKIEAEKRGGDQRVRDGEVTTACAQACPSEAIVFGDMNDPKSRVAALKKEPTGYGLLAELNTRPRTTYLGVIRNPNPEIR
jgi:molybdopterin-containing oxidoreductase family iron-sulfur binding subunit